MEKSRQPTSASFGVADRPLRLAAAENVLNGKRADEATIAAVAAAARAVIDPTDDIHGSGAYRRALLGTLVERALKNA